MHFSTLLVAASAAMALLSATPAQATDFRQLVKFSGKTATDFCNTWRCNCVNYIPKNKDLTFQYALCQPGDYHGQNMDTEAKAFCTFTDGTKTTLVNKHVAAASGATIVSSSS